jgi:tRNA1Val (adenine37-N6)-methyltransferase
MTFQFKQFSVAQSKAAMKIGTDAVLLGAWTPLQTQPFAVLDIGAGTGILGLMLAQRCDAEQIDAIEVDDDAFEECVLNFENSPWADRLYCYHADLQEFVDEMEDEAYDLIIANPPFYAENQYSPTDSRTKARFQTSLPFDHLLESVSVLLADEGVFSVIIPFKEESHFIKLAADFGIYPFQITQVRGNVETELIRSLIAFSRTEKICKKDILAIEISRHNYTEAYKTLTQDFYLKF